MAAPRPDPLPEHRERDWLWRLVDFAFGVLAAVGAIALFYLLYVQPLTQSR